MPSQKLLSLRFPPPCITRIRLVMTPRKSHCLLNILYRTLTGADDIICSADKGIFGESLPIESLWCRGVGNEAKAIFGKAPPKTQHISRENPKNPINPTTPQREGQKTMGKPKKPKKPNRFSDYGEGNRLLPERGFLKDPKMSLPPGR